MVLEEHEILSEPPKNLVMAGTITMRGILANQIDNRGKCAKEVVAFNVESEGFSGHAFIIERRTSRKNKEKLR
jgi:hypothetical protein